MNTKKKYNLTGQTFGKWKVLYEAEPYQNKTNQYTRRKWHCRCECGNEKDIIEQNLISGKTIQCKKCYHTKQIDKIEIGHIYGKLKVIKLDEEYEGQDELSDNQKRWICECQCGLKTIRTYWGYYLLNENAARRCGKIGCNEEKAIMENGEIVARLCLKCKQIKPIDNFRKKKKGNTICLDCEPYVTVTCMSKEEKDLKRRYSYYQQRAKKKNSMEEGDFPLTEKEFDELTKQPCIYCGKYSTDSKGNMKTYVGLDRYNNEKGYIKNNIIPCCNNCNVLKFERSYDKWVDDMKIILNRQNFIEQYILDNLKI